MFVTTIPLNKYIDVWRGLAKLVFTLPGRYFLCIPLIVVKVRNFRLERDQIWDAIDNRGAPSQVQAARTGKGAPEQSVFLA